MKTLILRLSSLGDVILAAAALEALPAGSTADWVVAPEFAPLLEGHPKIGRIWRFDRRSGARAWFQLCLELRTKGYGQVLDLHRSLRSRIARVIFAFPAKRSPVRWREYDKQRARNRGYFIFKRAWPRRLRPEPVLVRMARAAGGRGSERPDFSHLLDRADPLALGRRAIARELGREPRPGEKFIAVMPSSAWRAKCWPVDAYVAALANLPATPVIFGTEKDAPSVDLVERLRAGNAPHVSGVGRWGLRDVAQVLAACSGYLGSDTGLAHLAQALGVPSRVLYGPIASDGGFGPWQASSRAIETGLWCRPCSKDGSACFRVNRRHLCINGIAPEDVAASVRDVIEKAKP